MPCICVKEGMVIYDFQMNIFRREFVRLLRDKLVVSTFTFKSPADIVVGPLLSWDAETEMHSFAVRQSHTNRMPWILGRGKIKIKASPREWEFWLYDSKGRLIESSHSAASISGSEQSQAAWLVGRLIACIEDRFWDLGK